MFTILFDTWYITHACFYHFRLFTFIVYCLTQFAFLFSAQLCKSWCGYRVFNTFVWRTAATKPWVRRIDNLNSVPCMKSCAIHVTLWIHVTLRRCVDRKMWTFLHWNELGVASGKRWQCYMFNHCVCCYMKIKEIILLPFFSCFIVLASNIDVCFCILTMQNQNHKLSVFF